MDQRQVVELLGDFGVAGHLDGLLHLVVAALLRGPGREQDLDEAPVGFPAGHVQQRVALHEHAGADGGLELELPGARAK